MKRYDLRKLKDDFYDRMVEIMENEANPEEIIIFIFESGDYTSIQKSSDLMKENGHEMMNSLKYNEVDWTITVKRKAT